MPVEVQKVRDSASFPTHVDVVVIGAGIVGTCTAYELALRGVSVALLEKGVVGGEQSSRNWGWVRQQNRDLHELSLAMYSLRRWEELSAEIGRDLGFRRTGILYCTKSEADIARWEKWGRAARIQGFHSQLLSASEANERASGGTSSWIGGVLSPTDGRAEPSLAVPAIAEAAKEKGVSLHQNCAVRGLDIVNRRVAGVWTERGLVKAGTAVCAGGAWASRFSHRYGIDLPVANVAGTAIKTTAAPEVIQAGCLSTSNFALRRRIDGSYTLAVPGHGTVHVAPRGMRYAAKFYQLYRSKLGKKLKYRVNSSFWNGPDALGGWENDEISPFERIRVLDPVPDGELVKFALKSLANEYPALKGIGVERAWGGLIDTSPDLVPVISRVEELPGYVIAAGFSGHGFAIGPGAGRLVSEIVLNEEPLTDISPYRLSRFSDGSTIRRPEMM
ncbi:NAD(P)/FAD-dependent oxidoreductase [Sinorhizobium fredii]|uniref:FAD-binding oxidoreductase n=1 Tax=Rhizobium fredii TaxID=380 RepID=A0A2A6LXM6_RHIFR|nr:FAD-binding oxidoreductase [Sinorhizobium fredii]ASY69695.1 D-amino acid dehydrogenase small subunit [Sinorhizobium fredii CCBAU 83666]PDT46986.1 FAD-binding oxidoreductase [Sinorhizobium fredii]